MTSVTSAIKGRAGLTMVPVTVLGLLLVLLGPTGVGATDESPGSEVPSGSDAAPDVVLVVPQGAAGDEVASHLERLEGLRGVAWAAVDRSIPDRPVVEVGFEHGAGDEPLDRVESVTRARFGPVEVGGRAADDRALLADLWWGVALGVVLAGAALGGLVTYLVGWGRGLLAGGVLLPAAWFGGELGHRAAGAFDGTLATSPVPGALAGALVAGYLVLRTLRWFEHPVGDDQAEMIRRSVTAVGQEVLLTGIGLAVASLVLEPIGPGRPVVFVVLAGGLTAALLTLAVAPAALAALHGGPAGRGPAGGARSRSVLASGRYGTMTPPVFPFVGPNGRDVSPLVLAGVAGVLLLFGLASFRSTDGAALLERPSGVGERSGGAVDQLRDRLGDPTAAIVADFPAGSDQQRRTAWLQQVSNLPGVARVDTAAGRYQGGSLVAEEAADIGVPSVAVTDQSPTYALVVPVTSGRSTESRQLVDAVAATDAQLSGGSLDARLSGEPVDAGRAAGRDRSVIWFTLIVLALVGGVAAYVLVGDAVVAGVAVVLRLVESLAAVGLAHVLPGRPTGAEILTVLVVASAGASLFELGLLKRLLNGHRIRNTEELLTEAVAGDGVNAVQAVTLAALTALGLVASGSGPAVRLGLVAAVVLLIEVAGPLWVLRPSLLGDRVVAHFASQPVAGALRTVHGSVPDGERDERTRWEQVVVDLVAAEFAFQSEPTAAALDRVFVPDTALHQETADHLDRLASAGLRVVGDAPVLRSLKLIGRGTTVSVAATVDHPTRQLLDPGGAVVGVRRPERRSVMLWLASIADGGHRIVDAVELGTEPVSTPPGRPPVSTPTVAPPPRPQPRPGADPAPVRLTVD